MGSPQSVSAVRRARALEQLVEVVLAEKRPALLEALVIEHEALDDELAQRLRRPDAELGGLVAVHSAADGDDRVEAVEASLVVLAVGGSCFQNGNN